MAGFSLRRPKWPRSWVRSWTRRRKDGWSRCTSRSIRLLWPRPSYRYTLVTMVTTLQLWPVFPVCLNTVIESDMCFEQWWMFPSTAAKVNFPIQTDSHTYIWIRCCPLVDKENNSVSLKALAVRAPRTIFTWCWKSVWQWWKFEGKILLQRFHQSNGCLT